MLMLQLRRCLYLLCLIVGCAPGRPDDGIHEVELELEPPKVVAQRVARTVKRHAERLVRLETEHEKFLVTPEHPFATPGAGWIQAGRLAPGDQLVSAKFGTVRVLSAQSEKPAERVPVFNLGVEPSHAYLVGTDQVLVHNTNCKGAEDPDAKKANTRKRKRSPIALAVESQHESLRQELEAAQSELRELEGQHAGSDEGWQLLMEAQRDLEEKIEPLTQKYNRSSENMALVKQLEELEREALEPKSERDKVLKLEKQIFELKKYIEYRHGELPMLPDMDGPDWPGWLDLELAELGGNGALAGTPLASARVASDVQTLRRELQEERRAVEAADIALHHQYLGSSDTWGRPGASSSTPPSEYLSHIGQERLRLRNQWREGLQARLDATRQRLLGLQSAGSPQHEAAVEADLREQIALLEREMQVPL